MIGTQQKRKPCGAKPFVELVLGLHDELRKPTCEFRPISDRRSERRIPSDLGVRITQQSEDTPEHIRGYISNASSNGVCVRVMRPLTQSAFVQCEIQFPNSSVGVRTLMHVRWVAHPDELSYDCGLMYMI